ncbi:MAG: hypothetical protein HY614_01575 [Candidatus Rokubacteria bacterium]|nr:hypothetical protein [Candidatus Rokubacteria bacterium]
MNQRGIALPTALIALAILLALMVAFAALSSTEPMIAANHAKSARARALAEAGIERSLWASTTGTTSPDTAGTIPETMGTTADPPYDGSTFVAVDNDGGFLVRVTHPAAFAANERKVEAIGWTPNNNTADGRPKGVKKIEATLIRVKWVDPKCALCVKGDLEISGNSSVDARSGQCPGGPAPLGGTMTTGSTDISGNAAAVYGPGNNTPNEAADIPQGSTQAGNFTSMTLTDSDLAALKAMAKARGTYYQGSVTFNSSNPMPSGLVFVDTTTGAPFTQTTADTEAGVASISGTINFSGWLVVAGSININGNVTMTGLVYAQNDISYRGTGTGSITGAVISENKKYTQSTRVNTADGDLSGNARIRYDCQAVRDGGGTLQAWWVKQGTYREIEGQAF